MNTDVYRVLTAQSCARRRRGARGRCRKGGTHRERSDGRRPRPERAYRVCTRRSARTTKSGSAAPRSCGRATCRSRGTFGRAYVNGAMLSLLLGEARSGRPAASWVQPAFNVTVRVANASNGAVNTLTLHDVKIDNWTYNLPEDEFVMSSRSGSGVVHHG